MSKNSFLKENCNFKTERLLIENWSRYASTIGNETEFLERVISILLPEVTKTLPEGWQNVDSIDKANEWIKARNEEGEVLIVQYPAENSVVGFLFLSAEYAIDPALIDIRLGYLLSKTMWGKGLGSELIRGLVDWCQKAESIASLSGGVEITNQGSIRVLEKNGFSIMPMEDPPEGMIFLERRFQPKKL